MRAEIDMQPSWLGIRSPDRLTQRMDGQNDKFRKIVFLSQISTAISFRVVTAAREKCEKFNEI